MGDKKDCRKFTGKMKHESAWDKNRKRLYKGRLLNPDVKEVPNCMISKTRITRRIGLYNVGQKSTTIKRENVKTLQNENQARLGQDLNNILQLATERQHFFSRKNQEEKAECSFAADSLVSNWLLSAQNISPAPSCVEYDFLEIAKDSYMRVTKNIEDKINQRFPDGDKDYVKIKKNTLREDFHRSYRLNHELYTKDISREESPITSPHQSFSEKTPTFDKHEQMFSSARSTSSRITPKNEEFVLRLEPKAFPIPTVEKPSSSSSYNNLPNFCTGRSENKDIFSSGRLPFFPYYI